MAYQPELDAAQTPALDATPAPIPYTHQDLLTASQNFWAGRTGREKPPAPTLRMVNGRKMLGRYMDPFGCQVHIRNTRSRWEQWYTGFFVSVGLALLFGEVDLLAIFLVFPFYAAWYFGMKAKHTRQYRLYYQVQDKILQTGEPQWVPYDKFRLKKIEQDPRLIWP